MKRKRSVRPQDLDEDHDGLDIKSLMPDGTPYPSALEVISQLLLKTTIPAPVMRKLRTGKPAGVIIIVRDGWSGAIFTALRYMCSDALHLFICKKKPSNDDIVDAIRASGSGAPVVHIAEDPAHVPESARRLCELEYSIDAIPQEIVRQALVRCTRGRVPKNIGVDLRALPLRMVAAAIVSGGRTKFALAALQALVAKSKRSLHAGDEDLPPLEACVEYGELTDWGLRLGKDMESWKRGELQASDIDSSILLSSPPGVGKTSFVKILARHLDVPLFQIGIGQIFRESSYLNVAIENITHQFEKARANAPAILFLDEVDNFPPRSNDGRNNDLYWNSVTNHLLTLIDGVGSDTAGVILIGATNRPDSVDPALRRPGRLSRTIEVALPDEAGREHILRTHLKRDLKSESLRPILGRTSGMTAAELMHLVVRSRASARDGGRDIALDDLLRQLQPDMSIGPEKLRRVAIHEAGHAICAVNLPGSEMTIKSLFLHPSDDTSAGTATFAMQDRVLTRPMIEDRVAILLGGMAAEEVMLGDIPSSGSAGSDKSDLSRSTQIVAAAMVSHGLYGPKAWRCPPEEALEWMNRDPSLRAAVDMVLQQQLKRAKAIIEEHRSAIEPLAQLLLSGKVLGIDDITSAMTKRFAPLTEVAS